MQQTRDYLREIYLDWKNNYVSVEKFAEHNGITPYQASVLIELSREVTNSDHPDK